ncbi:unnamed protein product [Peniophora sp. CBMAI 1063]|nr:unnamed protein product [Peniophora sp. CBMAI 1063]
MSALREHRAMMSRLAAVFNHIQSPLESCSDAVGSICFLQMLLLADNANRPVKGNDDVAKREDARWSQLRVVVRLLPAFFEEVGKLNDDAMSRRDISVLAACSSLRWAAIVSMGKIEGYPHTPRGSGALARRRLQLLLKMLQRVKGLHLLKVAARNYDDLDELFAEPSDPRCELASRNALTLLDGARRCGWPEGWAQPDKRYLPKDTPCMWEWRRLFWKSNPGPKPAASRCLRAIFNQELVNLSVSRGPGLAVLHGARLDAQALGALLDLASIVDLQANCTSENDSVVSVDASAQDLPNTAFRRIGSSGTDAIEDEPGPLVASESASIVDLPVTPVSGGASTGYSPSTAVPVDASAQDLPNTAFRRIGSSGTDVIEDEPDSLVVADGSHGQFRGDQKQGQTNGRAV